MKTNLLIITAIFAAKVITVQAQVIPNNNFENWSIGVNAPPDGWIDNGSNHTGFYPVIQTNDKYFGNYAVKIESKITSTDTTEGMISTLRPNGKEGLGPAFPLTTRYNTLKGFYKFNPQNGDSAQIYVWISKTGFVNPQGWGNLLGVGLINLGASPTYAPFSAGYHGVSTNFYYFDNVVVPDSGYIYMAAYKQVDGTSYDLKPLGNSTLIIDAINYDSFLNGVNENMDITSNFALYPNVNKGAFDVFFETSKTDYTTITVYDLNGNEVKSLFKGNLNEGPHTLHYEVQELANGTYLFVVSTGGGYKAEKFTIIK